MTTATPVSVGINGYGGERSRGASRVMRSSLQSTPPQRLSANLVRLRVKARRDYLPQTGEASLSIGPVELQASRRIRSLSRREIRWRRLASTCVTRQAPVIRGR